MATIVFGPVPPILRPPRVVVALTRSLHHAASVLQQVARKLGASMASFDTAALWDASMRIAARLLMTLAVSAPDSDRGTESARHSW